MPPPPVTPSPHRFLSKPEHKHVRPKPKETPTPRFKALRRDGFATPDPHLTPHRHAPKFDTPAAVTPAPKTTAKAPQFATTPRFGHARPPSPKRLRRLEPEREREQEAEIERFATPRRFVNEHVDVPIEEEDSSHEDHELHNLFDHEQAPPQIATRPTFLPPAQPAIPTFPSSEGVEPPSPLPHRPIFLAPSSPQKTNATPLPQAFSPHRRGQKFTVGGMASEVRQWVLDTSHVTGQGKSRRGKEEWRVRVVEVSKNGAMALLKGVGEGGAELRVCLPGVQGRGQRVRLGSTVVAKGVWWDVEIQGETWTVAVEWKIIDDIG